jgi:hypothetical protein
VSRGETSVSSQASVGLCRRTFSKNIDTMLRKQRIA